MPLLAPHPWRTPARLFPATLLLTLSTATAIAQHDVHATLIPASARKPAPPFRLADEHGKPQTNSNYRGHVVLVNFWATTCGGCVLEIPSFEELQTTFASQGFTAVGISAEIPYEGVKTPAEAWQRVRPFIATHHVNYPILMGTPATIDSFGFNSYPATFLLDKTGRIAATYVGVVNKQNVEQNLKTLLAEHP